MVNKALFVALQDPATRRWSPVGRLSRNEDVYEFLYTNGAKEIAGFVPFDRMSDLSKAYYSKDLFPIFSNRVLPKTRPEHREYLAWLGLNEQSNDEFLELQRTAGARATDNIELIPYPEPNQEGKFEAYFFARGLSHMPAWSQVRAHELTAGDRLFLMGDLQNEFDQAALLMRTGDPISVVGYVPKYYSTDLREILSSRGASAVAVTVERVNKDAPMQYRVLCKALADWPSEYTPCAAESFAPYSA
jgi:hypothetical protein